MVGGFDAGQFGPRTVPTTLAPGVVSRRNGLLLADFTGPIGVEAAVAWGLSAGGKTATVVGRYVNTTPCALWVSTHFATLVADLTALTLTPNVLAYVTSPTNDCVSPALAHDYWSDLRALQRLIDAQYPRAGFVVVGPVSTDPTLLGRADAIEVSRAHGQDLGGRRGFASGEGIAMQADLIHPTAAGYDEIGSRIATAILQGGCLG